VSGHCVSRGGTEQLHQDCLEVFEEAGAGAEWDGDAAGKFFWAVGGLMRLGGFLFVCVVVCANEDVTS